jgi:hypothetical protein
MLRSSERGALLFSMIILLQIMMIISMILITEHATLLKQSSQFYQNQWVYFSARQFLSSIANELKLNHLLCNAKLPLSQSLQFHSKEWWQDHACYKQKGHQSYYYVISALGQDACAIVDQAQSEFVAEYYRLIVYTFDDSNDHSSLLLEQVYAVAASRTESCHSQTHAMKLGLQSEQLL